MSKFYDISSACKFAGVNKVSILEAIENGRLSVIGDRHVNTMISKYALKKWINDGCPCESASQIVVT